MLTGELPRGRFPAPSQRAAVSAGKGSAAAGEFAAPVTSVFTSAALCWRRSRSFSKVRKTISSMRLALVSQPFLEVIVPMLATLLGWIAVALIRRSAGKLCGLGLAVFDGLIFPLLALDFGLTLFFHKLGIACHWWTQNYDERSNAALIVWSCVTWPIVDFLIIRRVWRAVNGRGSVPAPQNATRSSGELPAPLTLWSAGLMIGGCVMTGADCAFTGGSTQGVLLTIALVAVALGWIASWFALSSMHHGRIAKTWHGGLRFAAWAPLIAAAVLAVSVPTIYFLRSGGLDRISHTKRAAEQSYRTEDQVRREAEQATRKAEEAKRQLPADGLYQCLLSEGSGREWLACEARVTGLGTASGSVAGGGRVIVLSRDRLRRDFASRRLTNRAGARSTG